MNDHRPPILDELDNLDVGFAPVDAVIAAGESANRRRRTLISSVAAVTVLLVGGGLVTTQVLGDDRPDDTLVADGRADQPPVEDEDGASSTSSRAFDALDMTLTLLEPRPDGLVPSRLRVENNTDSVVVDPGCRLSPLTNASGLVPVGEPESVPLNPGPRILVDCLGPLELPPGYRETFDGPAFRVKSLEAGSYLAVIDYGDLRTERVPAPFVIAGRGGLRPDDEDPLLQCPSGRTAVAQPYSVPPTSTAEAEAQEWPTTPEGAARRVLGSALFVGEGLVLGSGRQPAYTPRGMSTRFRFIVSTSTGELAGRITVEDVGFGAWGIISVEKCAD